MKSQLKTLKSRKTSQIRVNNSLTNKYKDTPLFKEKYEWAVEHFKDRDINKEIEEALKKDSIKKSR